MNIPQCPNCGATLAEKEKDGRKYWACPNWKPENKGCKGYFWSPEDEKKQPTKQLYKETPFNDRLIKALTMILAELKDINKNTSFEAVVKDDDN